MNSLWKRRQDRTQRPGRKGFTLVELIVVLVILAILAALLVPALTGYIDRAKEKNLIAETRSAVMAIQTIADEEYGANVPMEEIKKDIVAGGGGLGNSIKLASSEKNLRERFRELSELDPQRVVDLIFEDDNPRIKRLQYAKDGLVCTYRSEPDASKGQEMYSVQPNNPEG